MIVKIGETGVPDLQAMSDALRSHRPGDTVEIRFIRDGIEQQVTVVLGTREG